jgi:hypothetical protein
MYVANGILEWTDFSYFAAIQNTDFKGWRPEGKSARTVRSSRNSSDHSFCNSNIE